VPDYRAVGEVFAVSDGVETEFPLIKTFSRPGIDSHSSVWRITKPVVQVAKETNSFQLLEPDGVTDRAITTPLKIFLDEVEIPSGWTADATTGIVTFDDAPDAGNLSWTGEFDIPVRFLGNSITHNFDIAGSVEGITLQEVSPYELGLV
jgi:hypothetical protein